MLRSLETTWCYDLWDCMYSSQSPLTELQIQHGSFPFPTTAFIQIMERCVIWHGDYRKGVDWKWDLLDTITHSLWLLFTNHTQTSVQHTWVFKQSTFYSEGLLTLRWTATWTTTPCQPSTTPYLIYPQRPLMTTDYLSHIGPKGIIHWWPT